MVDIPHPGKVVMTTTGHRAQALGYEALALKELSLAPASDYSRACGGIAQAQVFASLANCHATLANACAVLEVAGAVERS